MPVRLPQIKRIVRAILKEKNISQGDLSLAFVTSKHIRALNKKFLRRDYATDVLAFERAGRLKSGKRGELRGDIVISMDAARKNAKTFQTSPAYEMVLYVVHGILHLLGFDDHKAASIKKMRREEHKLMKHLENKIKNII